MASSALIFGLFSLTNGHRHTVRTTHVVYTTYIQCDNDTSIEGEARMYSPASRPILPDNTVAFMYAKFVAPDNGNILLEAIRLIPFIGDETTDEYQDIFSDECFATIVAYGAVPTPHTVHDSRKHFPLAISDYVRDSVQQSQIECVLDTSTPRWANTRPPAANSSAQVVGVCHGLNSSGRLLVNVESLTYIPAATTAAATPVTPSPKKRVKYGPKTPSSVASTSRAAPVVTAPSSPTPIASGSVFPIAPISGEPEPEPSPQPQLKPVPVSDPQKKPNTRRNLKRNLNDPE